MLCVCVCVRVRAVHMSITNTAMYTPLQIIFSLYRYSICTSLVRRCLVQRFRFTLSEKTLYKNPQFIYILCIYMVIIKKYIVRPKSEMHRYSYTILVFSEF